MKSKASPYKLLWICGRCNGLFLFLGSLDAARCQSAGSPHLARARQQHRAVGRFVAKSFVERRELAEKGTTVDIQHLHFITKDLALVCGELDSQLRCGTDSQNSHVAAAPLATPLAGVTNDHKSSEESGSSPRQPAVPIQSLARNAKGVASELVSVLERLKLTDEANDGQSSKKRKRDAAKTMIKIWWRERDIEHLRARLSDLQQALLLRLAVVQSTSLPEVLATFDPHTTEPTQYRLERQRRYEESLPSADVRPLSPAGVQSYTSTTDAIQNRCVALAEEARALTACRSVLSSLAFHEIHDREWTVTDSHADTCTWIYEKEDLGFVKWATNQDGIFWITGKPGAGKSTLMKYLVNNIRTKNLLQEWAASDKLVVAYHYFWVAGTPMQKSKGGLLRTLLYYIILQCPETALDLVSSRFHSGNTITQATS